MENYNWYFILKNMNGWSWIIYCYSLWHLDLILKIRAKNKILIGLFFQLIIHMVHKNTIIYLTLRCLLNPDAGQNASCLGLFGMNNCSKRHSQPLSCHQYHTNSVRHGTLFIKNTHSFWQYIINIWIFVKNGIR